MNKHLKGYVTAVLTAAATATIATLTLAGAANAAASENAIKLLTAKFASRQVVQVEVGDFHFTPGQPAPVHSHAAPAVGYVAKGAIIYQIEGGRPQLLRTGDAFYEPTGQRILRFDNASATAEAVFIDFNLQQTGEPFIVFEKPPTEPIDRRSLPTIELDGSSLQQVEVYRSDLAPGGTLSLQNNEPTLGLVAAGIVEVRIDGQATQRIVEGGSFSLPIDQSLATIVNASSEVAAKVITFRLQ